MTTMECPDWTRQPGFLVNTFGKVRIILARVFDKVGKWNILIIGIQDNPRITRNGCTPDEVINALILEYNL